MFNLVLRSEGKSRMVYSTPRGFRFLFAGIALIIFVTILVVSEESLFRRSNIAALVLCTVCVLSSLFLERWIFDKGSNIFEKNVGLIFLYTRKRRPMDILQRVVLGESWRNVNMNRRWETVISPRRVILYVQDRDGNAYEMDIMKGAGVGEIRKMAEKLADFCGIPLADNLRDSSEEPPPD